MDSICKVALVPQHLLSTLMAQQQQLNPGLAQLTNLDRGMQNVLQNSDLPSDIKHKQYTQMMHNYQTVRDQELNKPMTINVKSADTASSLVVPDEDILEGMPKNYRTKAKLLLKHVKRSPNIGTDEKGQIVIDGRKIEGSNIADLIYDYSKPLRRNHPPARGWREFGRALKQTNVPREAIVNGTRWHEIDQPALAVHEQEQPIPDQNDLQDLFDDEEEEQMFETPVSKKRRPQTPAVRRGTRQRKAAQVFSPYEAAGTSKKWKSYRQQV